MSPSAVSLVLVAALAPAAPPEPAEVAARVDAFLAADWRTNNVTPEPVADDATFQRRLWLDLAGRVPPPLKARRFLDDPAADKRARLLDDLLAGDDFPDHWGRQWAEALTGKRAVPAENYNGRVLHEYLRDSLKAGRSYRQVATELLTGSGTTDESGAANFLAAYEVKPTSLAGAVGQQFLGVSLRCAQCHDHPFAEWKRDDFWGVAAVFARLRLLQAVDVNPEAQETQPLFAVLERRRGDLQVPDPKAKPDADGNVPKLTILPRLPVPGAGPIEGNRREALAAWVTGPDNPYFARHAVNQSWARLFGAPLLPNLDRLDRKTGTRREVLDLLADDFAASGHDVKRLVRVLALTKAYQLGSGAGADAPERRQERLRLLARYPVRPVSVDQLYQSVVQATGYRGEEAPPMPPMPGMPPPPEADDPDPPDAPVELLGERGETLQRTLALLHGEYTHRAAQEGAKVAVAVNGPRVGPEHVEWLFLATLARRPTPEEAQAMLKLARDGKGRRGLEDVLWVLMNSAEFNTNH
jgi:hypothetical protein